MREALDELASTVVALMVLFAVVNDDQFFLYFDDLHWDIPLG